MLPAFFTKPINTHPRPVAAVADLPAVLAAAATANLRGAAALKRIFFVPADYRSKPLLGYRYIAEQALIFTDRGALHVQAGAARDAAPTATFIPHDCLLYACSSLLLLYGRLELVSAAGTDLARVIVEYNTVGWHLLEPALQEFLGAAAGRPAPAAAWPAASERAKHLLQALPYKFANGLRYYGLTGGETLLGVVFQPAIWQSRYRGLWQRQITPNTLLALTDGNLIVIEEDRALFRRAAGRVEYGWIISHFPRHAISAATIAEEAGRQQLEICLALGQSQTRRRLLLDDDTAQAWRDLWSAHAA